MMAEPGHETRFAELKRYVGFTAAIRGAVDMTLRDVIVPGFEYLGLDTTAARRWLASVPA